MPAVRRLVRLGPRDDVRRDAVPAVDGGSARRCGAARRERTAAHSVAGDRSLRFADQSRGDATRVARVRGGRSPGLGARRCTPAEPRRGHGRDLAVAHPRRRDRSGASLDPWHRLPQNRRRRSVDAAAESVRRPSAAAPFRRRRGRVALRLVDDRGGGAARIAARARSGDGRTGRALALPDVSPSTCCFVERPGDERGACLHRGAGRGTDDRSLEFATPIAEEFLP